MTAENGLRIERDVPLAQFTTLGVGGNANYYVRAETEGEITEALRFARDGVLDVFILGGGSNIVVADGGFDGLVIHVMLKGIDVRNGEGDTVLVRSAAGEDWDAFVAKCVAQDLAGLECLSGIPGYVGGTPVQNVGAYGQEVAETITSVRCLDRESLEFVQLSNAECGFEYRKSIFNSTIRDRYIVVGVEFALRRDGAPKITYKDLIEHLGDRNTSLQETRDAVLKIRRSKSMVIDERDPNSRSAGSFFKNPVVPISKAVAIANQLGVEKIPQFGIDDENVKIPAAWLIEQAGIKKGFALRRAGISENHSLAIINRGGATAAEIIALKEFIQTAVNKNFGIMLHPEPIFIGFSRIKEV